MDKTIDIYVNGSYLRKNHNRAGVQGEGNVTVLHITFDESWAEFAKKVTFWDARGENPVKRTLTTDLLVDFGYSLLEYNVPIPAEPLLYEGDLTFVIEGYIDGKRKRSVQDTLIVDAAMIAENEGEPVDPTPTQAEQLQKQIDALLPTIQADKLAAEYAADMATLEADRAAHQANVAQGYANTAESYANNVNARIDEAIEIVDDAEDIANRAAISADSADKSAADAKASADSIAVDEAKVKAEADRSEDAANVAKSYAVGGTNTRIGEDADNAKYYASIAKDVAGGDFVTPTELEEAVSKFTKVYIRPDEPVAEGEFVWFKTTAR